MFNLTNLQSLVARVAPALAGLSGAVDPYTGTQVQATLSVPNVSNYNPSAQSFARTFTDYPLTAFFSDYEQTEIDGVNVKQGDQHCLVLAQLPNVNLSQECKVTLAGKTFHVISFAVHASQAFMDMQLRGVGN